MPQTLMCLIARRSQFIDRHRRRWLGCSPQGLRCVIRRAVESGVVSIDGTGIAGTPARRSNHTFEQIAREITAKTRDR
jgi:hypothetical protein